MRKVKEILRLHFEAQLSERQISKICQVGKGTIRRYLERLRIAGLSWPLPDDLDEMPARSVIRRAATHHARRFMLKIGQQIDQRGHVVRMQPRQ